jgi:hypothetical protein
MATTVGASICSDDMVVAQSDKIVAGTMVESLVIEFDQAKYEEYLSSNSSSPRSARKCRQVSHEPRVQMVETGTIPESLKVQDEEKMPLVEETNISSLSKRARQRRRQARAKQVARALTSFDGLNLRPRQKFENSSMKGVPTEERKPLKQQVWQRVQTRCSKKSLLKLRSQ